MRSTMTMIGSLRFFCLIALAAAYQARFPTNTDKLKTIFEWKDLEYGFPTEADRQNALNNQLYVPHNGIPIDVDVHYKGNVFSTVIIFTIYDTIIFRFFS